MSKVDGYAKVRSKSLRWLLRSPLVAVAVHWTFQGLLYMDHTERWFKIALDLVLTALGGVLLGGWMPWYLAWGASFLIAHTLNFLFNAQLWGVLKHYGFVHQRYDRFVHDVAGIYTRAEREPSIDSFLVYGSLSRQQWVPSSDLDARMIRHPGFLNGIRACWFLMLERSRALVHRFPLDLYVFDSEDSLARLDSGELPVQVSGHSTLVTSQERPR